MVMGLPSNNIGGNMAEVLSITRINKTPPFGSNGYNSFTMDGIIYVVSNSVIYTFDPTTNTYIAIHTPQYSMINSQELCTGINGKIYYYTRRGDTYRIYINAYDVNTKTTTTIATIHDRSWNYAILYATNWRDDNYCYFSYLYKDSGSTGYGSSTVRVSGSGIGYYSSNHPLTQQVENYYFGRAYTSSIYTATDKSYGLVYKTGQASTINGKSDFSIGNNASFERNGKVYLIYANKNIIIYDSLVDSFTTTEYALNVPAKTYVIKISDDEYRLQTSTELITIKFIVYNYTYKISSFDGSKVYSQLTGQSPLTEVSFFQNENDVLCTLKTITDTNIFNITPDTRTGYLFSGFALRANASKPDFILGETYEVSIDSDTVFYAVYKKYEPPKTTFDLNLYQNTAETNRVDKSLYLSPVGTLSGALRERCSLVSPVLTIEYPKVPDFNYVYIEAFGRYYFVTGVVSVRYNLWEISLECDVLMTYKDKLLECEAFIDRNENTFNPLIVDRRKVIEQGQNIIALTAENEVFGDTGSYIMVASNTGVGSANAKVIFDSGVTVRIGETEISSGGTISAYPVVVTCNKETCYINGRVIAQASVIEIDAQQSIYITTAGADREVAFTVTINDTPD